VGGIHTFEQVFARSLHPDVVVDPIDGATWVGGFIVAATSLGEGAAEKGFATAVDGYDFLCPDYQAGIFAPFLLALRNGSNSPTRLLFIAHAPAATVLEWALLQPLLRAGDLIAAPSNAARDVIRFLCPALEPFVRVIPHAQPALPRGAAERQPGLVVSLTRLEPEKLVHRQIEAIAILRRRGHDLRMEVAGGAADPVAWSTPYARSLVAKVRRLGLDECVAFVGHIEGDAEKAVFLQRAELVLNLSTALEESFGQAIAQALTLGVPVLATNWSGLPETVGRGGSCVPVVETDDDVDVAAESVADAVAVLRAQLPAPGTCIAQAARYQPERIRSLLARELAAALAQTITGETASPAASRDGGIGSRAGLLASTAPLTAMSWDDLFAMYLRDLRSRALRDLRSRDSASRGEMADLAALLWAGMRRPLCRFLAHIVPKPATPGDHCSVPVGNADLCDRAYAGAISDATPESRVACLRFLAEHGRDSALGTALAAVTRDGVATPTLRSVQAELLRRRGEHSSALGLLLKDRRALVSEFGSEPLSQLAKLARELGKPELALPWVRSWLTAYPDSPDSAIIWLERAALARALDRDIDEDWRESLGRAEQLLGPLT
jgi:glycosyltransferase involved in cell wall biosynthesis